MATIATKKPGQVSTGQYNPQEYDLRARLNAPGGFQNWSALGPGGQEQARQKLASNDARLAAEQKAREDLMKPIPAPKRDPRITALMQSQRELAKRFRAGMPGYIDEEFQAYSRDRGRELQGEREDIDASYNRRGLLRSGMQAGASGDAGARATRDLYDKRLEIGDRYRQTADALDDEALNTEIALAGGQAEVGAAANAATQKMQDLILEQRLGRQQALESAFGAFGDAAGRYWASRGGNGSGGGGGGAGWNSQAPLL